MSGEELKACPCCDGPAYLVNGGPGNHFVKCAMCGLNSDDGDRGRMIAKWNRRSSPPQNDAGVVIASLRKRYLAGARDVSGARKERTRCSHYVQVLDELSAAIRTPMSELQALDDRELNTNPVVDHEDGIGDTQTQALGQEFEAGWRTIETAPKDGTWVMCWGPDSLYGIAKFGPNPIWAEYPEYTHWLPLPSQPFGEGSDHG